MSLTHSPEQELDRQHLIRLHENLIDETLVVEDILQEIRSGPRRLQDAIARRDLTAHEFAEALRHWNHGVAA